MVCCAAFTGLVAAVWTMIYDAVFSVKLDIAASTTSNRGFSGPLLCMLLVHFAEHLLYLAAFLVPALFPVFHLAFRAV
jgi:hypothetical protein